MARIVLRQIAQARSGDKGDILDVSLFAPTEGLYSYFADHITADVVKEHLRELVKGPVTRYEVPNVRALKFVCEQALDGGGSRSLRVDNLGKCFGANLLRMELEIPDELLEGVPRYEAPAE
jgi:hypothetical protein